MKGNKAISLISTAAICAMLMNSFMLNVHAETITNISVDFTDGLGNFKVESSDESYPIALSTKYPGWLDLGNGYGTVTIPDEELAGQTDKVNVSFEVAYGLLKDKYYYHTITDSNGTELVNWSYDPYDGRIASDVLGEAEGLSLKTDVYTGSKTPVTNKSAVYNYEFDFALKTVKLTVHNNDNGKDAVYTADLPSNAANVKKLKIGSDYKNTDRQCVIDNISITTTAGEQGLIPFTINYLLDGNVVKTKTAMGKPGTVVTADSRINIDDMLYFVNAITPPSMTITDGDENVLNVEIREAKTCTVTVKAAGDLDEIINEYQVTEGGSVSYVYPMYMLNDGVLCQAKNSSGTYYGGKVENVTDDTVIPVDYLGMYENCVLYEELDSSPDDNASVRASNCSAYVNKEYTSSQKIEPGNYTFIVRYQSKGRGSVLKIGDTVVKEIGLTEEKGSWTTKKAENIYIAEEGNITLEAGSLGSYDCLDTIAVISEDPLPEIYENRISDITKTEDRINIDVSLATAEKGSLVAAMYDINNTLIKVDKAEVSKSQQSCSFEMNDAQNVRTVKACLWDGTENMTPIAETKEFEILMTQKPQTVPSAAQQMQIDRKYGMFIHFSINTFVPGGAEWTDGSYPASLYNPTQINAEQWVKSAKDAGMSYIILVTKHHDGFCLWDTKYTDYSINSSPNKTDVVKAVADACEKYGIKLGMYYSLWDRHERTYPNPDRYAEYMKNQLTELLDGRYGEVVELWLDGGWERPNDEWHMDELYDLIKRLQPNCVVGVNNSIGEFNSTGVNPAEYDPINQQENQPMRYFPCDFRLADPKYTRVGADADPKLFMHDGEQYYMPFEATRCIKQAGKWFWSEQYPQYLNINPQHIVQKYKDFTEQQNVLIVNCAPNRNGEIDQYDADTIKLAGEILGIGSSDVTTQVFEFENSKYTDTSSAPTLKVYENLQYGSGTGYLGGWNNNCSAEFTVNSETDRTARLSIVYGNGNDDTALNISVNGENVSDLTAFHTPSGALVMTQFIDINLKAGENKVVVTTGPESKGPNFDCMYIQ